MVMAESWVSENSSFVFPNEVGNGEFFGTKNLKLGEEILVALFLVWYRNRECSFWNPGEVSRTDFMGKEHYHWWVRSFSESDSEASLVFRKQRGVGVLGGCGLRVGDWRLRIQR